MATEPASAPTLSARRLNRALLARQLLLAGPGGVPRALERWPGCRRSTRRRCTSGCGPGSTGSTARPGHRGAARRARWSRARCCARPSTWSPGPTTGRSRSAVRAARREWYLRVDRGPAPRDWRCGRRLRSARATGRPAGRDRPAARRRPARRRRAVARPGPGAAVGHLGAAAGRPVRRTPRTGSARHRTETRPMRRSSCWCAATSAASARPPAGRSPAGPACRWPTSTPRWSGCRCAASAPRTAPSWSTWPGAAARPGHAAPVRFLPGLGRDACSCTRGATGHPAGGVPAAGVQHEDAAVGQHVPGGRRGGRGLAAARRAGRDRAVRAAAAGRAPEVEDEAERLGAFHA